MMPTSLLLHLRYSSNELNKPLYNLNHCKYSFFSSINQTISHNYYLSEATPGSPMRITFNLHR